MSDTSHIVSWEIIECPKVSLVKLAGRDTIRNRNIKLARNLFMSFNWVCCINMGERQVIGAQYPILTGTLCCV